MRGTLSGNRLQCDVRKSVLRFIFPNAFGPNADQSLDREAVVQQFTALAARISESTGILRTPEQVAEGFLEIAVANMANAISTSVQRGYDVTRYVLTTFGGAGGQHACFSSRCARDV